MLVFDSLLVALSPLLLEDHLHRALGVLHDRGFHFYASMRDERVASEGVVARAHFVDVPQCKDIADVGVLEVRYGEEVSRGENVFSADERGNDVLGWLGADDTECRRGGVGLCVQCTRCNWPGVNGRPTRRRSDDLPLCNHRPAMEERVTVTRHTRAHWGGDLKFDITRLREFPSVHFFFLVPTMHRIALSNSARRAALAALPKACFFLSFCSKFS